jgi:hypothetical protein
LSESYIYGTATLNEKDYSINIQQAANRLVVLPQDFSYIGEINKGLFPSVERMTITIKELV